MHFKRTTYLVEPGPDTSPLGGKSVRVHEWDDGRVEIRAQGRSLTFSIFDQHPHIARGAVVETSVWARSFRSSQTAQIERDRTRLASTKLTLRQKDLASERPAK